MEILTPVRLRYTGEVIDLGTAYDDQDVVHTEPIKLEKQFINTTVGRAIFNDSLPSGTPFVNGLLKKKGVQQLVHYVYLRYGIERTVLMLDELKELGFLYATKSGISIGIDDMLIPGDKSKLVEAAEHEVVKVQEQYHDGAITNGERYNKVIDIWGKVTERVADEMFKALERQDKEGGHQSDLRHGFRTPALADRSSRFASFPVMRGLMAKPSGKKLSKLRLLPTLREGLTVLQLLHFHARRSKGSRRHGVEDGRLRLSHSPPR